MLFNSLEFAVFLPVVLALYYCLATRAQNVLLLLAGYVFYGWWDWRFLGLLWLSTLLDYAVGRILPQADVARRKWILIASLACNLTILGFFKYYNFFSSSAAALLESLGLHASLPTLHIILPVGVSFYTFQSIAYTVDVYRGRVQPERDLLNYSLYVAFFPQLLAGPIERADHLIRQLVAARVVTAQTFYSGLFLILVGLFKKVAIADSVGPGAEEVFNNAGTATWMTLLKGAWFFTIQIYCDFSGYTDMARGVARLLGINLMENFNQPYFASNITEFWRRWHISLSTWLRDYLYIPLGGSRGSRFQTYRNLMLTMLLGGLWHGANWTFVIWGGIHGCYLALHKLMLGEKAPITQNPTTSRLAAIKRVACVLATLHLVMLAWIFFRANSLAQAVEYLAGIFSLRGGSSAFNIRDAVLILFYALLVLAVDWPQFKQKDHLAMLRWPVLARGVGMAVLVLLLLILGENNEMPFIYFQF